MLDAFFEFLDFINESQNVCQRAINNPEEVMGGDDVEIDKDVMFRSVVAKTEEEAKQTRMDKPEGITNLQREFTRRRRADKWITQLSM